MTECFRWFHQPFRSSSVWVGTHTTVTFSPKCQRNCELTGISAARSSATPGSSGSSPTIASVKKTWGRQKSTLCTVNWLCSVSSTLSFSQTLSTTGTDQVDFKFYDLLEQILEKQPSTSSTVITDSIEISEDSNGESVTEKGKLSSVPNVILTTRNMLKKSINWN